MTLSHIMALYDWHNANRLAHGEFRAAIMALMIVQAFIAARVAISQARQAKAASRPVVGTK